MPTTIFTDTLTFNNTDTTDFSFRQAVTVSGASLGQVRVTFKSSGGMGYIVAHASIGIHTTNADTAATPVELLFSGVSGFNIALGTSITSDWLTFAFSSSDLPVCIADITSGSQSANTSSTGQALYYKVPATSYATAAVIGYSVIPNQNYGISLIETQAVPGGAAALKLYSSLNGLGASGPFFHDRLARSILGWRRSLILPNRRAVIA